MGKQQKPIVDWDAFREEFSAFGTVKSRLLAAESRRDAEIAAVKARYDQNTAADAAEASRLEVRLREFLAGHKGEFGNLKDRFKDLPAGRVGFRRGKRTLGPVMGKTWEAVLVAAKEVRRRFGSYLEVVEQLDKKKLGRRRSTS